MKITVQIDGEEVASAATVRRVATAEVLEKAAATGAEDAGPAPALTPGRGTAAWPPSKEMEEAAFLVVSSIDCGEAPKEFQAKAESGAQAEATSTEPTEAEDAGKAAGQ